LANCAAEFRKICHRKLWALSITTLQSNTMKECQGRAARPLEGVHISQQQKVKEKESEAQGPRPHLRKTGTLAPTFVNPVLLAVSHHYASELTALCTGHIYSCTATKATTIPVPYGNITSHMWSREQHVTITALELLTVTSYLWASPSCSYLK